MTIMAGAVKQRGGLRLCYAGGCAEGCASTTKRCPTLTGGRCLSAAASPVAGRPAAVPRAVGWRGVPPRPRRLCRRGRPPSVLSPAVLMPHCLECLSHDWAYMGGKPPIPPKSDYAVFDGFPLPLRS